MQLLNLWGLPSPTMIPLNLPSLILDRKDCFFTIPLHPDDAPQFPSSVPTLETCRNNKEISLDYVATKHI